MLAQLNHANIAAVYGIEDAGGQRFIAMELVEGETLAERLQRRGRIDVEEALEIARQITAALETAHKQGIVHRDLKPANIKVTPAGEVKVLDFGLAKTYATDGAQAPFFSPDGQWVGFFANETLQKVPVSGSGGAPLKICDTGVLFPSATWGLDDTIIFAHFTFGLYKVPASAGTPEPLTLPDAAAGEWRHFAPQILPGGQHALFTIASNDGPRAAILSLASNEWSVVLDNAGRDGYRCARRGEPNRGLFRSAQRALADVFTERALYRLRVERDGRARGLRGAASGAWRAQAGFHYRRTGTTTTMWRWTALVS